MRSRSSLTPPWTVDFYLVDPRPGRRDLPAHVPRAFKPFEAMPQELQTHIRYPEDLLHPSARIRRTRMDTPEVLHNREDLWQFPREQAAGDMATMAPYYIIMRYPGDGSRVFPHAPHGAEQAGQYDCGWLLGVTCPITAS